MYISLRLGGNDIVTAQAGLSSEPSSMKVEVAGADATAPSIVRKPSSRADRSTVNEREPIRKADGGSPDFDASEGRNNEGEKVREGFVLLEGEDDSSFSRGREKEKCVLEGEGEES